MSPKLQPLLPQKVLTQAAGLTVLSQKVFTQAAGLRALSQKVLTQAAGLTVYVSFFPLGLCVHLFFSFFFFNVYLFLGHRETEHERGGAEREGDTESETGTRL